MKPVFITLQQKHNMEQNIINYGPQTNFHIVESEYTQI